MRTVKTFTTKPVKPHSASREVSRKQTPTVLREMPYEEYLKTRHWSSMRRRALVRACNRCQVCNSPYHLHVHHRTYVRLGEELMSDLTVLCATCHKRHHDAMEKKA